MDREDIYRQHIENVPGAGIGITLPLAPFRLSAGGARIDRPPPQLGAHTAEILSSIGYSAAELASLRAKKVV